MSSFNENTGLGYLKTQAVEFVKYPLPRSFTFPVYVFSSSLNMFMLLLFVVGGVYPVVLMLHILHYLFYGT